MSLGEVLLTLVVALVVFGPNKMPQLIKHVTFCITKYNQLRQQLALGWQSLVNEQKLQENVLRAKQAEEAVANTMPKETT